MVGGQETLFHCVFSSLVNHSGYLSCCFYDPPINNPLALNFVLTGAFRLYVFFSGYEHA
jgi:hypothetical protein